MTHIPRFFRPGPWRAALLRCCLLKSILKVLFVAGHSGHLVLIAVVQDLGEHKTACKQMIGN